MGLGDTPLEHLVVCFLRTELDHQQFYKTVDIIEVIYASQTNNHYVLEGEEGLFGTGDVCYKMEDDFERVSIRLRGSDWNTYSLDALRDTGVAEWLEIDSVKRRVVFFVESEEIIENTPVLNERKHNDLLPDACAYCGRPGRKKRCSICRLVIYCNKECQVADWEKHRVGCNQFRK